MTDWWRTYDYVLQLAQHMHTKGKFDDVDEVLYFFEKPWKYDAEWNALMQEDEQKRKEATIN